MAQQTILKNGDKDMNGSLEYRRQNRKRRWLLLFFPVLILSVLVCGCAKRQTVRIGTSPDAQMQILSEMAALLFEQKGYPTETVQIDDGLQTIQSAALGGSVDLYPSYTGEGWARILNEDETYRSTRFSDLKKQYESMGLNWVGVLPVYSKNTLAVLETTADKYDLKSISDLKEHAKDFVFGTSAGYLERPDGFPLLQDVYDLSFKTTRVYEPEMLMEALHDDNVDVISIRSNDGRLYKSAARVLIDDRMALPELNAGFVATDEILKADPDIRNILEQLKNVLSAEDLVELNARVEEGEEDPADVASDFLKKKGMIPG